MVVPESVLASLEVGKNGAVVGAEGPVGRDLEPVRVLLSQNVAVEVVPAVGALLFVVISIDGIRRLLLLLDNGGLGGPGLLTGVVSGSLAVLLLALGGAFIIVAGEAGFRVRGDEVFERLLDPTLLLCTRAALLPWPWPSSAHCP